jgi:hypothetical protein
MSQYAEIENNVVVNVIVADAEFIATQTDKNYVLCSGGGIGWSFDGKNFIAPQPYPSWTLDENNNWQPPTPMPTDSKQYAWFERNQQWIKIVEP